MSAQTTTQKEEEQAFVARPVTLAEVKDILDREQAARAELTYEQKLAHEHVTFFAKLPAKKADELVKKLVALGGRVTEAHARKIVDVMPTHPDDLRAIFAKDRSVPDPAEIDRIIEAVRSSE